MIESAGLLMYKRENGEVKVFLCKTSSRKNPFDKIWGIPKGKVDEEESLLGAAKREFFEETNLKAPNIPMFHLGSFIYPSKLKKLHCWIFEYNPPNNFKWKSNTYIKNGNEIPEIDAWEWFTIDNAKKYIMLAQQEIIEKFEQFINHQTTKNIKDYGEEF